MRSPWNCPYCEHKSNRRWNLGVHIARAHPGKFNPVPGMKGKNYGVSERAARRNISLPDADSKDPLDRTLLVQSLLLQIEGLDTTELMPLFTYILKRLTTN